VECRVVSGRVLHVSVSDTDGDGDMHLLLASGSSTTAPGISLVKIPRRLRPPKAPAFMSWVSIRGAVLPGGHGEDELHAERVQVGPR
jgi:hypothetical protein